MEAIFACTPKGGIGLNGKLPWRIKEDMKLFKKITTQVDNDTGKTNAVIMGRNTWESIPEKFRPLPNRINIIISTTMNKIETEELYNTNESSVYIVHSISELDLLLYKLKHTKKGSKLNIPFIIGGAKLYNKMFELDKINKVHLSLVNEEYECDTFIDNKYISSGKFRVALVDKFEKFTYFKYIGELG
jgi:dihydrofolate reductase